jgi:hypothetical protein
MAPGALSSIKDPQGGTMAEQHRQARGGTWGIPVILAFLAGGVVGWLASTLRPAGSVGGRRHRHYAPKASLVEIQKYLRGADYPAQKDALLATARAEGADAAVLHTLSQLPDTRYSSPIEVSQAIGRLA